MPIPSFYVDTDFPVAVESYDHLYPRGAIRDNSSNPTFNLELIKMRGSASVLDLGCAGGKFVWSLLACGCPAVGIEGSDRLKQSGGKCWKIIPDNLFTADITKPFTVYTDRQKPYLFDMVTLWEVFEHILTADLPAVFENIRRHLKRDGWLVVSVSDQPSRYQGGFDLHRTQQDRQWWFEQFDKHGFVERPEIHKRFAGDLVRRGACFSGTFGLKHD